MLQKKFILFECFELKSRPSIKKTSFCQKKKEKETHERNKISLKHMATRIRMRVKKKDLS